MKKKIFKILCMTGTRADYPRVKPVLKLLDRKKNINLQLYVTGQHMEKKFGYTVSDIKKDKFKIYKMSKIFSNDDKITGMNSAFERCFKSFSETLKSFKPDLVLLTVDRIETIACSTAAMTLNYPIAHIQGGEITGTMDETLRHCVSKMSNVHFVANHDAKNRLVRLGEDPTKVFNFGCPYAEEIRNKKLYSKKEVRDFLKIKTNDEFILFVQHPVTSEIDKNYNNFKLTTNVLNNYPNFKIICLSSNADAGGQKINSYISKNKNFISFKNLSEKFFLSILKYSKFMIGNSSAGIREAPTFKTPVINIGTRQFGRLRSKNIIDCDYDSDSINNSIQKIIYNKKFKKVLKKTKNLYEGKNTSENILKKIENILKKGISIQKKFYEKKNK